MMQSDAIGLQPTTQNFAVTRTEATRSAAYAIAFGVFLVFLAGFAHTDALHNGAHNTRHALSFPCH
jgi:cobalt transporter subunit CbtB